MSSALPLATAISPKSKKADQKKNREKEEHISFPNQVHNKIKVNKHAHPVEPLGTYHASTDSQQPANA